VRIISVIEFGEGVQGTYYKVELNKEGYEVHKKVVCENITELSIGEEFEGGDEGREGIFSIDCDNKKHKLGITPLVVGGSVSERKRVDKIHEFSSHRSD
jgi:hypothetical protein